MSAPTLLRLAFDSGWSHGDPGDGRLRFDNPKTARAGNLCVNARDAQEAMLDELIPTWRVGEVVVIERPGAERNRVVVWIIGPIVHMGSFYRAPILVRSVHGAFAAHDELVLHHHRNVTDVDETNQPRHVTPSPPMRDAPALSPPPLAPLALTAPDSELSTISTDLTPLAPMAVADPAALDTGLRDASRDVATEELDKLRADNTALHDLLAGLLSDKTELYTVEHT